MSRGSSTAPARGAARVAPRNVPLATNATIGPGDGERWTVLRHVADGGFSSVYAIRPADEATADRHGAADRALKCVWGTPDELTAIKSEADTMSSVSGHSNVVGLISHFRFGLPDPEAAAQHPGDHFLGIVQELAAEDLYGVARRCGPDERTWAAAFEQIAAGLEHVHARRVVHGDIKPTNLLRIGGRFALADFGVSAPLDTTRSAGIGLARTLPFWPPESGSQGVVRPDGVRMPPSGGWRASQSGDVWALAVSMHRVLTGRHITVGGTPEQQYELVCAGHHSVDAGLGPDWRALLEDCLTHEPDRRKVSTAAALRARLAELTVPHGVPVPDGPLPVGVLAPAPGEGAILLSLSEPGGRVIGTEVPADAPLLPVVTYAYSVLVPALGAELAARAAAVSASSGDDDRPTARLDLAAARAGAAALARAAGQTGEAADPFVAQLAAMSVDMEFTAQERDRLAKEVARLGAEHRRLVSALAEEEARGQRLDSTLDRVRGERGKAYEDLNRLRKDQQRSERERMRLTRQLAEIEVRGRRAVPPVAPPPYAYPVRPGPVYPVRPAPAYHPPRRRRMGCFTWLLLLLVVIMALLLMSRSASLDRLRDGVRQTVLSGQELDVPSQRAGPGSGSGAVLR